MSPRWRPTWRIETIGLALFGLVPLLQPFLDTSSLRVMTTMFIYGVLALALNVVVGYAGLLHLGIAAFFGIGAYITGIATIAGYPFQIGFLGALVASTLGAGLLGCVLAAPTLRLRGDYLALVTLGFGEVVRFTLRNLEEITAGTRGLGPIPPPELPRFVATAIGWLGIHNDWIHDYRLFYYLALGMLAGLFVLLGNLEKSRLGRAWVAIREDELAATCMGVNAARVKLSAFALSAALAGAAGCLYATTQASTTEPNQFDFNRSIIMLCCLIIGGLGSLRGALLGVALVSGFEIVLTPFVNNKIQEWRLNPTGNALLSLSTWNYMVFGLALIFVMRWRPEGLLPSRRVREELHPSP